MKEYHKRMFLNKKEGMAAIEARAILDKHPGCGDRIEGSAKISDCGKQIYLEFWGDSVASTKNAIEKLDKLIDVFTNMRATFVEASKEVKYKPYKEKKK